MKGIGRHLLAMAGILLLSSFAGQFTGPADPFVMLISTCIIFPVALISYLIGIWLTPFASDNERRERITITLITVALMIVVFIIGTVALYRLPALRSDQPVDSMDYEQIKQWCEKQEPERRSASQVPDRHAGIGNTMSRRRF